MKRRHLLGGIAAGLLRQAATARASQPLREITLINSGRFSPSSVEMMNAVAGGFFAAEGLSARLLSLGAGSVAIAALLSGHAELVRANGIDLARAVARQNVNLVAIGVLTAASGFVLVSAAARPVRDAAGLRGARVGVLAVGSTTDVFLDLLLHESGLAPDSVTRETVGSTEATFDLIARGRVDAAVLSYSVATELVRSGAPAVLWQNDAAVMLPGRCLVATRQRVRDEPDLLAACLRAIRGSMCDMATHGPAGPVARAAAEYELTGERDRAAFTAATADEMTLWSLDEAGPTLRNDRMAWVAGCAKLAAAGLGRVADPAALATDAILNRL